jgi:hypothetical protein
MLASRLEKGMLVGFERLVVEGLEGVTHVIHVPVRV